MSALAATRPDTLGPYFPPAFADGATLDLLRPGATVADAITLDLIVFDGDGRGATNLLVETWQSDGAGRRPGRDRSADPRLASIGRLLTRDGRLRLRTLRPGGGNGRAGWITLTFYSDGLERLATQVFLADDPALANDPLLGLVPDGAARLVARGITPSHYALDIQLSAQAETPFFASPGYPAATALRPYPGDNTSVERTPLQPPVAVPEALAPSLLPWIDAQDLPEAAGSDADWTTHDSAGRAIEIAGAVLDPRGTPLPGTVIELWAANTRGRYRHPDDRTDPPLDPGYDGLGRLRADANGRYRVRLIAPGAYLARPDIGRWRPGHLHASLIGPGNVRLVTQLYFPGDPHHAPDPMRISHGDDFDRQLLHPDAGNPDRYRYDFVIGAP